MNNTTNFYRVEPLGRPAVFLIPNDLMEQKVDGDHTCRKEVEEYMATTFGGFTDEGSYHNGFWRNANGKSYTGKYQKNREAFIGKEHIHGLAGFLSFIAGKLGEESIYLETGEDAWLIYPASESESQNILALGKSANG